MTVKVTCKYGIIVYKDVEEILDNTYGGYSFILTFKNGNRKEFPKSFFNYEV